MFGARAGKKMRDELKAAAKRVVDVLLPLPRIRMDRSAVPVETTIVTNYRNLCGSRSGIVRTGAD